MEAFSTNLVGQKITQYIHLYLLYNSDNHLQNIGTHMSLINKHAKHSEQV